jgi:hypothetical protein
MKIRRWIRKEAKRVLGKKDLIKLNHHQVNTLVNKQAFVVRSPMLQQPETLQWSNGRIVLCVIDTDVQVNVVLTKECCLSFIAENDGSEIESISNGMQVRFDNLKLRVYRLPNNSSLQICYIAEKIQIINRMASNYSSEDFSDCTSDEVLQQVCNGPYVDWIYHILCLDSRGPPSAKDCIFSLNASSRSANSTTSSTTSSTTTSSTNLNSMVEKETAEEQEQEVVNREAVEMEVVEMEVAEKEVAEREAAEREAAEREVVEREVAESEADDFINISLFKIDGEKTFGFGLKTNKKGNVYVSKILNESVAHRAGLKVGDIIIKCENVFVGGSCTNVGHLASKKKNISLSVRRPAPNSSSSRTRSSKKRSRSHRCRNSNRSDISSSSGSNSSTSTSTSTNSTSTSTNSTSTSTNSTSTSVPQTTVEEDEAETEDDEEEVAEKNNGPKKIPIGNIVNHCALCKKKISDNMLIPTSGCNISELVCKKCFSEKYCSRCSKSLVGKVYLYVSNKKICKECNEQMNNNKNDKNKKVAFAVAECEVEKQEVEEDSDPPLAVQVDAEEFKAMAAILGGDSGPLEQEEVEQEEIEEHEEKEREEEKEDEEEEDDEEEGEGGGKADHGDAEEFNEMITGDKVGNGSLEQEDELEDEEEEESDMNIVSYTACSISPSSSYLEDKIDNISSMTAADEEKKNDESSQNSVSSSSQPSSQSLLSRFRPASHLLSTRKRRRISLPSSHSLSSHLSSSCPSTNQSGSQSQSPLLQVLHQTQKAPWHVDEEVVEAEQREQQEKQENLDQDQEQKDLVEKVVVEEEGEKQEEEVQKTGTNDGVAAAAKNSTRSRSRPASGQLKAHLSSKGRLSKKSDNNSVSSPPSMLPLIVGKKISVYYDKDKVWYNGVVIPGLENEINIVEFDDGDIEQIDENDTWKYCSKERSSSSSSSSSSDNSILNPNILLEQEEEEIQHYKPNKKNKRQRREESINIVSPLSIKRKREEYFWNHGLLKGVDPVNSILGRTFARACSAKYCLPAKKYLNSKKRFDNKNYTKFSLQQHTIGAKKRKRMPKNKKPK